MNIGVPKEIKDNEKRVALTPSGARDLVLSGNKVFVETEAGSGSGFKDDLYIQSGAVILSNAQEVFDKSEFNCKK